MRLYLVLVFSAVYCLADWSSDDAAMLRDIRNNQYDTNAELYKFQTGYYPTESGVFALGWKDFYMESYRAQRELSDGTEYKFRKVDGRDTPHLVDQHIFSDNNDSFFDLSPYAQSNESYYGNNILGYFSDNADVTINQNIPDSVFLSNPYYGDVYNKFASQMWAQGFGIDAIQNSAQTAEIRNEVSEIEMKVKNVISSDYTDAVLNYDFSELGNYFVRNNTMLVNPWNNLKGQLRIKPNQGDLHYEIWHRYFDRTSSNYAIVLKWCLHTVMFIAFTIYVINDLMSIVDA